jgi:hypothetical protein
VSDASVLQLLSHLRSTSREYLIAAARLANALLYANLTMTTEMHDLTVNCAMQLLTNCITALGPFHDPHELTPARDRRWRAAVGKMFQDEHAMEALIETTKKYWQHDYERCKSAWEAIVLPLRVESCAVRAVQHGLIEQMASVLREGVAHFCNNTAAMHAAPDAATQVVPRVENAPATTPASAGAAPAGVAAGTPPAGAPHMVFLLVFCGLAATFDSLNDESSEHSSRETRARILSRIETTIDFSHVVKLMRAFTTNEKIQQSGCTLLSRLLQREGNMPMRAVSAGALTAIAGALRSFPMMQPVAASSCQAILTLLANHPKHYNEIISSMFEAGAVDAFVQCMAVFAKGSDPLFSLWCCNTLIAMLNDPHKAPGDEAREEKKRQLQQQAIQKMLEASLPGAAAAIGQDALMLRPHNSGLNKKLRAQICAAVWKAGGIEAALSALKRFTREYTLHWSVLSLALSVFPAITAEYQRIGEEFISHAIAVLRLAPPADELIPPVVCGLLAVATTQPKSDELRNAFLLHSVQKGAIEAVTRAMRLNPVFTKLADAALRFLRAVRSYPGNPFADRLARCRASELLECIDRGLPKGEAALLARHKSLEPPPTATAIEAAALNFSSNNLTAKERTPKIATNAIYAAATVASALDGTLHSILPHNGKEEFMHEEKNGDAMHGMLALPPGAVASAAAAGAGGAENMKRCCVCGEMKSKRDAFSKTQAAKGSQAKCKQCAERSQHANE